MCPNSEQDLLYYKSLIHKYTTVSSDYTVIYGPDWISQPKGSHGFFTNDFCLWMVAR